MKFFLILVFLMTSINPISYAKYNWSRKNRLGAVGAMLIGVAAAAAPAILWLMR